MQNAWQWQYANTRTRFVGPYSAVAAYINEVKDMVVDRLIGKDAWDSWLRQVC